VAPVELRRAPSAEPMAITIRHPGYHEVTRTLVLDHDQTLAIVLSPKVQRVATRVTPKPTSSSQRQERGNASGRHASDLRNPFE
jgi:hypothetical protein